MINRRHTVSTFLLIYCLSVLVNFAAIHFLHVPTSPLKLEEDAREYLELSRHLLGQAGQELDSRRVPGHVLILAALGKVSGDNLLLLQAMVTLLFSFTAPLTFLLGRRIGFAPWAASAAGVFAAVWPVFISYGITLYSETTALPIFLTFLVALPKGERISPGSAAVPLWHWSAAGLLLGISILTRPMYMIFVPFLFPVLWAESGSFLKTPLRFVLVLVGTLVAISPWSCWISHHENRFILVSTNGGETIAGGINPNIIHVSATYVTPNGRISWVGPGKWIPEYGTGYLNEQELQLPRFARNKLLQQRALAWMLANPWETFSLECHKLAYMWGIYPFWNGVNQTLFGNVPTLLLLLLATFGIVIHRFSPGNLMLACCLPLFASAVALISWGSWRFREPGDVGVILLGIVGIGSLIRSLPSPLGQSARIVENDSRAHGDASLP